METLFLALSDKTRLRILNLLRDKEICVYYFTEILKESQPKISRHLAYLKSAGIVSTRREGKWIHYRIKTPASIFADNILQNALKWLASQKDMQGDYTKLLELKDTGAASENEIAESAHIFEQANIRRNQKEELETFML